MEQENKNKRNLGLLYIGVGLIDLTFYGLLIYYLWLFGFEGRHHYFGEDWGLNVSWSFFTFLTGCVVTLISIPTIIAGAGVLLKREWANKLAQALGFIYLFIFPLGTLLGAYTFIVFWKKDLRGLANNSVKLMDDLFRSLNIR